MIVDLTKSTAIDEFEWQTTASCDLKCILLRGQEFPVVHTEPVTVTVKHASKGQVVIDCTTAVTVDIPCDRCIKPVAHKFLIDFQQETTLPFVPAEDDADDSVYLEGMKLDVDQLVCQEVLLDWPAKVLCNTECKGLCTVCGQDLNVTECGCNRIVLDPRMAAIQDIFNSFNQNKD